MSKNQTPPQKTITDILNEMEAELWHQSNDAWQKWREAKPQADRYAAQAEIAKAEADAIDQKAKVLAETRKGLLAMAIRAAPDVECGITIQVCPISARGKHTESTMESIRHAMLMAASKEIYDSVGPKANAIRTDIHHRTGIICAELEANWQIGVYRFDISKEVRHECCLEVHLT